MFCLPVSRLEGEKINWLWQKKKEVGEEANFWNVHVQRKKQKTTIYSLPIAHSLCQHVKILSVCVALKKTDPSCAVLRRIQKGSLLSRGKAISTYG